MRRGIMDLGCDFSVLSRLIGVGIVGLVLVNGLCRVGDLIVPKFAQWLYGAGLLGGHQSRCYESCP